jgi:hypothetical protein
MLTNSQAHFKQNEEQLHPEGNAQDAVLAVVDAEALILPANEDGGNDIASPKTRQRTVPVEVGTENLQEQNQESIMEVWMVESVENAKQNDARRSGNAGNNGQHRQHLLPPRSVVCQPTRMAQIPLEDKGQVQYHYRYGAHGNEERLQIPCAYIRNVPGPAVSVGLFGCSRIRSLCAT